MFGLPLNTISYFFFLSPFLYHTHTYTHTLFSHSAQCVLFFFLLLIALLTTIGNLPNFLLSPSLGSRPIATSSLSNALPTPYFPRNPTLRYQHLLFPSFFCALYETIEPIPPPRRISHGNTADSTSHHRECADTQLKSYRTLLPHSLF